MSLRILDATLGDSYRTRIRTRTHELSADGQCEWVFELAA